MNDDLFGKLVESVREGGAILKGRAAPSRAFEVETPEVEVYDGHRRTPSSQEENPDG
ncbi:MAG: hypothetical protein ACLF0P_08605 [Thermoanaerobaculia bacterium]